MHANACLISFQKVSTAAVVSAVERALVICKGTVYVDLRSVPAPSLNTLDIIGKIYGRVAKLAPQRNVVPLLSTAYPQGSASPSAALFQYDKADWSTHVTISLDMYCSFSKLGVYLGRLMSACFALLQVSSRLSATLTGVSMLMLLKVQ
jgi:hypothetical protein